MKSIFILDIFRVVSLNPHHFTRFNSKQKTSLKHDLLQVSFLIYLTTCKSSAL